MLGARGWITLVALLAVPLPGCGTLLIDNPQKVVITSGPPGARVEIDGAEKGVTPLEVQLTTDKSYDVVVTASGYPPQARVIRRSIKALYIVGDILLAVIPLIVDIATDSLHTLSPKEIHVQFEPVVAPPAPITPPMPAVHLDVGRGHAGHPGAHAGTGASTGTEYHCCVNRAYYDCPDAGAVARCAPPELAGCLMNCGMMDASCPEGCLDRYPPDPSDCSREAPRDSQCR